MNRSFLGLVLACCAALAVLGTATSGHAIPAFARRYQTSCQTCHIAFPRLTPFGEAFRRNGFRFPGGGDATAVKEEPVALGNDAQKDLWPKAVWPGEIAGSLPLSIVVDGKATLGPNPEEHLNVVGAAQPAAMAGMEMPPANTGKLGWNTLGGHVGLRAGGAMGDFASVFASIDIGGHEPIDVERGWLNLTPAGPTALHIRMGRFEPSLHGVSIHRGLFMHQLRLVTTSVGANPWLPEPRQTGLEVSGVAIGRFGWNAGVVDNAAGTRYLRKDVYARAEYKIGGMRLDGLDAQATGAPWSERSLLLGGSFYSGRASIEGLRDDDFWRAGLDLHAIFDDLMLDAVAVRERHDQPFGEPDQPAQMDQVMAELSWIVHAFSFPTARFEMSRTEHHGRVDNGWLASLLVTAVVRPNVVLRIEGDVGADATTSADFRSATLSFSTAF
jgi:hypothetical protein